MTTTALQLRTLCSAALIGAALCAPAHASEATRAPVEQLVTLLGPFDTAAAAGTSFRWGAPLPLGAMLHGVVVELVDADGRRFEGPASWGVSVSGGDVAGLTLRERGAAVRMLSLPRPLGLRIGAGDSIAIRGDLRRTDAASALYVRVTVEYEPLAGPVSRMAVLPLPLLLSGHDGEDDDAGREWYAPTDGRLMMMVGVPADAAGVLRLEDAETGATLWHDTLRPAGGEGFGRDEDVVRIGAMVRGGRSYRVTLEGAGSVQADRRTVHVLLAPVRTVAALTAQN